MCFQQPIYMHYDPRCLSLFYTKYSWHSATPKRRYAKVGIFYAFAVYMFAKRFNEMNISASKLCGIKDFRKNIGILLFVWCIFIANMFVEPTHVVYNKSSLFL